MPPKDSNAIPVMAESDKKKEEDAKKKKKLSEEEAEDNMSEEDKELKERLETCVSTVLNENKEDSVTIPIRLTALDVIVTELRTATSSMTSVPKPLKFLRPHFEEIKTLHTTFQKLGDLPNDSLEFRARLADVLSVLAMTMGKPGTFPILWEENKKRCIRECRFSWFSFSLCVFAEKRESLKFKLEGAKDYETLATRGAASKNAEDNLGSWGHEFVRSLAGEIGQEYNQRVVDGADPDSDEGFEDLLKMVYVIAPFHVTHNAEAEAVDLLIEVQRLKYLLELDSIDENNYQRICLYLVKTASFMSDPDDLQVRSSGNQDLCAPLRAFSSHTQHCVITGNV